MEQDQSQYQANTIKKIALYQIRRSSDQGADGIPSVLIVLKLCSNDAIGWAACSLSNSTLPFDLHRWSLQLQHLKGKNLYEAFQFLEQMKKTWCAEKYVLAHTALLDMVSLDAHPFQPRDEELIVQSQAYYSTL